MRLTLRAVRVFQFLMRWASSRMTRSGDHVADQVEVAMDRVVIGDLEEGRRPVERFAALPQAADDLDAAAAGAFDLALPLVLERRRADDQDALDAEERAMISAVAMAWIVLPRPISSPIRQRPARAANSAPSR